MERRERLVELDYFNAAACLMVMLIHVLSLRSEERRVGKECRL